jgi:uncharacterized membrane-anchored protein YhcB (DUF1043 family)
MDLLASMDLQAISISLVALIVGVAIGWLVARSRLKTKIAELNTNLILERRVNKQLSETLDDAVPNLFQAPNLTMSVQPAHEPSMLSS